MKQDEIRPPADTAVSQLSLRLYRRLINLYPASFREEYGPHMVQVFGDCVRDAARAEGASAVLALWGMTLFDLFKTVLEEHLQRGINMSRSTLIRVGGWAMIAGAILLFTAILMLSNQSRLTRVLHSTLNSGFGLSIAFPKVYRLIGGTFYLMPLAMLLIAVGLAAAQATYRGHVGRVAHAAIRLAFASALLASASGLFLLFDLGQFAADLSFFTFLAAFGAALFFAGLFAAGTLRNRALSPVAAVPLALGGLVTALFVLREFLSDFGANGLEQMLGILVLLIAAAGFALLGATLQAPQAAVEVVPDTS